MAVGLKVMLLPTVAKADPGVLTCGAKSLSVMVSVYTLVLPSVTPPVGVPRVMMTVLSASCTTSSMIFRSTVASVWPGRKFSVEAGAT